VIYTVLYSYLFGWVVTSIGLALTVRKLRDPVRPPSHPIPLVVAAGAAWPLVVLGAAQIATLVLVVNVARSWASHRRSRACPEPRAPGCRHDERVRQLASFKTWSRMWDHVSSASTAGRPPATNSTTHSMSG
jgi:hypothetical protein